MIEHTDLHLKKYTDEYVRILNVSVQITEQLLRQRRNSEHCQTLKIRRFVKRIISECKYATRNFSGLGKENFGTRVLW